MRTPEQVAERFWSKVKKTGDCWIWNRCLTEGYGYFWCKGKMILAHRYIFEISKGEIPKDMTLDHLCRNRACVNPEHLEIVTRGENVLRGEGVTAVHSRKTHCKRGHLFDKENTYLTKQGRACLKCRHNYYQKNKDKFTKKRTEGQR